MAKNIRKTSSMSGFSLDLEKDIKEKAQQTGKEEIERLKNQKSITNKKEIDSTSLKSSTINVPDEIDNSIESNDKKNVNISVDIEKEATSITLDADVLMKMRMYCKANKITLSGEINKYLKSQYIPNKKVNQFLKNLF